ncbi:MAG: glycosyltransferase family 4 protein [Chloroflexi bacterium]|nr:glycosyltransferase family 4 protein [Chloroflexota bacterium]
MLLLNYEFPPLGGGGSTSTAYLVRALARLGHEIDVVTMGFRGLRLREQIDGVAIHRVPCLRSRRDICHTREMASYLPSALIAALRLSSRRSFDVNSTFFIFPTGPLGYLLSYVPGPPYVLSARGSDVPGHNPARFRLDHRVLRPVWKQIVRRAGAVVAVSNDLRHQIRRLVPDVQVDVIPNGFSPVGESATTPLPAVDPSERARRILVVSRLYEFKGVQYLFEALTKHRLEFTVDVVGDGLYRAELERLAAPLGDRVRFWGWLDRNGAELRDLYARDGIFVFPSEREGAPNGLLEAMGAGLAVVAANSAGSPEVVGNAGVLVQPRDSDAIARALSEFDGCPQRVEALGRLARARVETEYNWDRLAERYATVYRRVMIGKRVSVSGEGL